MATLWLSDGMHLCETGGAFVVLDLPRDRYSGLTPPQARALRALLTEHDERQAPTEDAGAPMADALQPLLDAGVLTTSEERGRPPATAAIASPDATLLDASDAKDGRVTAGRLAHFLGACVTARRRLRGDPIQETVAHVRQLSARAYLAGVETDLATTRDLTRAFLRLRPFYPLDRRCLFESLALIEFLARFGVHPTWVFGVRLDPWKAHCWVQHGRVLFNDDLEEVAQFTPIMAA